MKQAILRKLGWFAGTFALFQIFGEYLPNSIFKCAPATIAIMGGILIALFVRQAIFDDTLNVFLGYETHKDSKLNFLRIPISNLQMFLVFGMYFTFISAFNKRKKIEIQAFGIHSTAVVLDVTTSRGVANLTVQFSTQQGQLITTDGTMSYSVYDSVTNIKRVSIRYSSKNPQLIELFPQTNPF
jgi:hypothetical protein